MLCLPSESSLVSLWVRVMAVYHPSLLDVQHLLPPPKATSGHDEEEEDDEAKEDEEEEVGR